MLSRIRRFFSRFKRIRFAQGEGVRSRFSQLFHISSSLVFKKFTPLEFYLYGFYRKDQSTVDYVPNRWIEREFRTKLNPLPVAGLLKNKMLFFQFFSHRRLPVPRILGLFHPRFGSTREDTYLRSMYHLEKLLIETKQRYLVLKPPCALGGKGLMIVEKIAQDAVKDAETGQIMSIEDLYHRMRNDIENRQPREDSCTGYLIQEYVTPHKAMNPMKGKALNTVRIATLKDAEGGIHLDFAMLRMARPGAVTDNLHKGGMVAGIDLSSGTIKGTTYGYENEGGPWIEKKPIDLGSLFLQRKIPRWEKMVDTVRRFHRVIEGANSIGWDVALSRRGPLVIEGNDNWDMVIAQVIDGPYLTPERKALLQSLGVNLP